MACSPDLLYPPRLNNPFLPQANRLQPKREPSPVSGERGRVYGAGRGADQGGLEKALGSGGKGVLDEGL